MWLPSDATEAIDQVEHEAGDDGDGDCEREGFVVPPGLDRVVDGDGSGLCLTGDVARDHDRDAEVAERTRKGECSGSEHTLCREWQCNAEEDASIVQTQRARSGFQISTHPFKR